MSDFDIGDQIRLSVAFTDLAGTAADPTTVVCTVRKPDNTTSTPSVTNDSTGAYHSDLTLDLDGSWYFRFAGTGALVVAEEGTFVVSRQRV